MIFAIDTEARGEARSELHDWKWEDNDRDNSELTVLAKANKVLATANEI